MIRVLVVDDTPAQRYARAKTIAAAGFQVLEAANGHDALERARDADVVVLDVFLPDIGGLEVCRRLRDSEVTAQLPIIHVSAVLVADDEIHADPHAGADACLIEPIPPEVLIQVIRTTYAARRGSRTDVPDLQRTAKEFK
jgi:CheY-like chemotaxis protein